MTVSAELEAEIRRLHQVEGWPIGTVANQLGVHHDVVETVLGLQPLCDEPEAQPRLIDPFRDFVADSLAQFPRLCSTRMFDMLVQRGYLTSDGKITPAFRLHFCVRNGIDTPEL